MKFTIPFFSVLAISTTVMAYGYGDEPVRKCTKTISKTKWITSRVTKPVYITRSILVAKTTTVTKYVTATAAAGSDSDEAKEE
ncbi:hypothetical protein TWF106_006044 [Orbilia oligospora]|uniref:Uncharacterized protein n=1 Tax=Orbilia oligospora TaxID=2813651 RepID=A0A6G1LRR5_ORBOL|nr:hypothetical protein TWF788_001807 [Orbilia oligospora]KAF3194641.1 hypothetical protein TWF106_006044 [Orbilia oligospora]KAF3197365.1 hypothetical protein TWF679_003235 [Orbilia oligospora]KAF3200820.1 hypothetical protein TWF191_003532 [Orbilia oligospora]KAF3230467.1 hypothetical protein TWF192_004674 [Orbilia oligospora]